MLEGTSDCPSVRGKFMW